MLRLAVVLPMYNEADNVTALLERLDAVRDQSGVDIVALAIDDGSRDATYVRLTKLAPRFPFLRITRHERNRGIAAALRLVAPIKEDRADFVLGSRYVPGGRMRGVPWPRRFISIAGNAAVRRVLGVSIGDLTSGFRAVRAEVFRAISLEENGFGIQLEGTVKAYRAGFRVAEVPITLGVRKNGYSKMAYTRSFWLGYARLVVRLWLKRRMLDSPVRTFYAEVEDP